MNYMIKYFREITHVSHELKSDDSVSGLCLYHQGSFISLLVAADYQSLVKNADILKTQPLGASARNVPRNN